MSRPISALCSAIISSSADMPAFFDLEVAERERTGGYPSEFRVDGDAWREGFAALAAAGAELQRHLGRRRQSRSYGGSYEYYKLQLSALYTLTRTWWLQVGGFSTYAGRNALQENGVIFGVWHQF